jgi:iron complex transport system permease protein
MTALAFALRRPSPLVLAGGLASVLLLLVALSLCAGRVWIPLNAVTAFGHDPRWTVIVELRLPRTLLALLVGAALGAAGAALQGYTRNHLADPFVLGVSSTAGLGAVLVLYFGLTAVSPWLLPAGAMVGAAAGLLMLLALAGASSSVVTFVLAGIVIQTMATAATTLALNLAPTPWAVDEIVNWLMGAVADRSFEEVKLAAPFIAVGVALLLSTRRALDALTLGELGARALGVNLAAVRLRIAIGVALAIGASVAVTGVIGFVGLITPHLMRPWFGNRPGALIVPSAVGGAVLLLAADVLVRMTPAAVEIRLGAAMAVLGGPFFLALLIRMRRRIT